MNRLSISRPDLRSIAACGLVAVWASACALRAGGPAAPAEGKATERLKAAGREAKITVFPVRLAGSLSPQVGEVLGMILERGGMPNMDLSAGAFQPPDAADLPQIAAAFGKYVQTNPIPTEFALFADFVGVPGKGVSEIRGVIVNSQGEVAWQDRQTPNDADFKRIKPAEPMTCCLLVVERLRPVLKLGDPNRGDAPEGKLAERWSKSTGLPDEAERAAMSQRLAVFKKSTANATLGVYPPRVAGAAIEPSAEHLTKLLNEGHFLKAAAMPKGPSLELKGNMNEQVVLWDMARAFREYVRSNPPDADYVLFADYLMGKDSVGGVHFAVCNRHGEWVIVDFQNNHHVDFKAIKPKSAEDCDRLVKKRLETLRK